MNENIQTLAMNSCMQVYTRRGPPASPTSNMSCTMSTFWIRAIVLGAFKGMAFVSKRAAFLLQGKEKNEVSLWEEVAIEWGPKAEGVSEGATDGALDGLRGKVGGSTGVFKVDRVTTWENAWVTVSLLCPYLECLGRRKMKLNDVGLLKCDNIVLGSMTHKAGKKKFFFPWTDLA